jgi:dihydrodipicolinate synthase/N-acetylneuraminate lyase
VFGWGQHGDVLDAFVVGGAGTVSACSHVRAPKAVSQSQKRHKKTRK